MNELGTYIREKEQKKGCRSGGLLNLPISAIQK